MYLIPILAALAMAATASAQSAGTSKDMHTMVSPGEVKWGPAPAALPSGAQVAVLGGDPGKDGLFIMRIKMPDGYQVPAHWHSRDENVTVISGSFGLGVGEEPSRDKGRILEPGGFVHMPAHTPHYAWAKGDTVVQVSGIGPFDLNLVGATGSSTQKR
jgi:quercetin dioxygenase-like cupin family protein